MSIAEGDRRGTCANCGSRFYDDNEPCYAHENATPEWPVFHTPSEGHENSGLTEGFFVDHVERSG